MAQCGIGGQLGTPVRAPAVRTAGRATVPKVSERSSCSSHRPRRPGLVPPPPAGPARARPVWELRAYGTGVPPRESPRTAAHPPHGPAHEGLPGWFDVRFTLDDGTRVDVFAAVVEGRVHVEELRTERPLPPRGLAGLAARLGESLDAACPAALRPRGTAPTVRGLGACPLPVAAAPRAADARRETEHPAAGRLRRRAAVQRAAAEAYRRARARGGDPVEAVMSATGYGRRKALRTISGARDAGLLPRHARR